MSPDQTSAQITAKLQASDQQRRAADPAASVWVSASAGTGKTKVLADRVLSLLLAGTPPHRLLCLTFTKAAAAEMANRITARLGDWSVLERPKLIAALTELMGRAPVSDELITARGLFAAALDTPGGLKIQTIHSFCQSLLGRFPLEAGIAPRATPLDEATAAGLMTAAREAVFASARATPGSPLAGAIRALAGLVHEGSFADLTQALGTERGRLADLLGSGASTRGIDRLVSRLARLLDTSETATREGLIADYCADLSSRDGKLRQACAVLAASKSKTDVKRGEALADFLAASDRPARYGLLRDTLLKQDGEPRKDMMTKALVAAFPALDDALHDEAARLVRLEERLRAAAIFQATAALLRVGSAVIAAYAQAKDRQSLLDFDDLILRARDLLAADGGAAWVHYKLDQGIDHVLIDEAQDTNPEQWAVVTGLTQEFFSGLGAAADRPRGVFAVGDAKQSIFSFQRADPAAFRRMERHFSQKVDALGGLAEWRSVNLAVSFRSAPAVLRAVDAIFAQPAAADGVAEAEGTRHVPARAGAAGLVELWPPANPGETPTALEAWAAPVGRTGVSDPLGDTAGLIARRIKEWLTAGEMLESRGRPVRPSDFLILVRSRGRFVEEMVRRLKQLGVPVAGVDRMVLTNQLAIMDLIALGQFLLLPEDDLTLATVLKGPLIGLDEESLFTIAHGRPGGLWRALNDSAESLPAAEAARARLATWLAEADYRPPFEFYADVLARDGGRARFLARLGEQAADPIDEFLNQALAFEQSNTPSLQGFLQWLVAGEIEVKRDGDTGERDEVRIMTVHGAKGLQAPIVILPDTMRVPRSNRPKLLWPDAATAGDEPPLWSPRKAEDDPIAASRRAAIETAERREYRRLLYVALTRAEDRLYVTGWRGKQAEPEDCWYRLISDGLSTVGERVDQDFADFGYPDWRGPGWRLASPQTAPVESSRPIASAAPTLDTLPGWARLPPAPEPSPGRPLTPSGGDDDPPARSPLGDGDGSAFHRGRLIHRLLQTLPELPEHARPRAAARFLARPLHELDSAAQALIADETLRVLGDPAFSAVFGPGSRAEVPIVGLVEGVAVSGRIDRLAVLERDVLIIDFKTNRPPPAEPERVAPAYLAQMRCYRDLVARLYPGKTVRAALLWTDGPRLMPLPDALLTATRPRDDGDAR